MKNTGKNIYPSITLYQPWATWIMREWKTIETRTHNKFGSLLGKRILIHAGLMNDSQAVNAFYHGYLSREKLLLNQEEMVNGYILGSVFVKAFGKCSSIHSKEALIDCGNTERFGLYLSQVEKFETPIACKGEMGIWYYDLDSMMKVKKPV